MRANLRSNALSPKGKRRFANRGGTFEIVGHMTFQGFPLSHAIPFADSNDSVFLSTVQPFTCTDTTLTYYLDDPLGPVLFFRGSGDSTP